jgi:hypothetical protein
VDVPVTLVQVHGFNGDDLGAGEVDAAAQQLCRRREEGCRRRREEGGG